MKRALRKVPRFRSEDDAREFWATHDSTDHVAWSRAERLVLPNLRPTSKTISLRLPESLLEQLKVLANRKGVPYQSLLKVYLSERVARELKPLRRRAVA